jgi:hypothetical protein
MKNLFKISASALFLLTFAAAPAILLATADHAYAKNGNGGGNGGGKGGGNGNGGDKGNSGKNDKSSGNKGAGKDKKGHAYGASNARKNGKSKSFGETAFGRHLKGVFGKPDKKASKADRKPASKSAPRITTSKKPVMRPQTKGVLHPSNLGKLNGMINSSPKAKLAHIANGNFNGTVGLAAALAVADFDLAALQAQQQTAADTLEVAAAYDVIAGVNNPSALPTEAETDAAKTLLDPGATDAEIAEANSVLGNANLSPAELQSLATSISQEDYANAVATTTDANGNPVSAPTQEQINAAIATTHTYDADIAAAKAAVNAAEDAVIAEYKGALSTPTPEQLADPAFVSDKEQVLDEVRSGLPSDPEIDNALLRRQLSES